MEHGLIAGVEPGAGKAHIRAIAFLQPKQVAIKGASLLNVLSQDREMVHGVSWHVIRSFLRTHRLLACTRRTARAGVQPQRELRIAAMRARNSGSNSASNQGFWRCQPRVRQEGCGNGT